MWSIKDLKTRAWNVLKKSYLPALFISFIMVIVGVQGAGVKTKIRLSNPIIQYHNMIEQISDLDNKEYDKYSDDDDKYSDDDEYDKYSDDDDKYEINKKYDFKLSDDDQFKFDQLTKNFSHIWNSKEFNEGIRNNSFLQFISIFGVFIVIGIIIGIAFKLFLTNPLEVSGRMYFVRNARHGNASINDLGYSFKNNKYMNIVKALFRRDVYIFLWGLLPILVITGLMILAIMSLEISNNSVGIFTLVAVLLLILTTAVYFMKIYSYVMAPYILADNPEIGGKRAIQLSSEMMRGNKFHLWVLELSFIGWYILGIIAFGFGIYFVYPYVNATKAELYEELRVIALNNDITSKEELGKLDEYLEEMELEKAKLKAANEARIAENMAKNMATDKVVESDMVELDTSESDISELIKSKESKETEASNFETKE